jgi:hypothetical protein
VYALNIWTKIADVNLQQSYFIFWASKFSTYSARDYCLGTFERLQLAAVRSVTVGAPSKCHSSLQYHGVQTSSPGSSSLSLHPPEIISWSQRPPRPRYVQLLSRLLKVTSLQRYQVIYSLGEQYRIDWHCQYLLSIQSKLNLLFYQPCRRSDWCEGTNGIQGNGSMSRKSVAYFNRICRSPKKSYIGNVESYLTRKLMIWYIDHSVSLAYSNRGLWNRAWHLAPMEEAGCDNLKWIELAKDFVLRQDFVRQCWIFRYR